MATVTIDDNFINDLDARIKSGKLQEVQKILDQLESAKVKRPVAVKIANIARRVGYHRFALKHLAPIVRPNVPLNPPVTDQEQLEYALSLMRVGATNEANILLNTVKDKNLPELNLYKAYYSIGRWDYANSIPLFEKYISSPGISEYQKLVARINLSEAYVAQELFKEAEALVEKNIADARAASLGLAIGNALQVQGELYAHQGLWERALNVLNEVEKTSGNIHYRYSLYVKKWRAIINCSKNPSAASFEVLESVREEARQRHAWEVVRDCDAQLAKFKNDDSLLLRVYFGTPYDHYRERILRVYKKDLKIPKNFDFKNDINAKFIFDVEHGIDHKTDAKMKPGHLIHKLLVTLASDFYRPFRAETLFSLIFPGDYYDPEFSNGKVYDTVARLRSWFEDSKIPLLISEDSGEYRLETSEPYILRVGLVSEAADTETHLVKLIEKVFGVTPFSIQEVLNFTQKPRATVKRYLADAVVSGLLVKTGKGRSVKYAIKK